MHQTAVKKVIREGVLDANDGLAQANREKLDQSANYAINTTGSSRAGKKDLLECKLEILGSDLRLGIVEGDAQTILDVEARPLPRVDHAGKRIPVSAARATSTPTWSVRDSRSYCYTTWTS